MRVVKPSQRRVSGDQLPDSFGHRRRWCYRVNEDFLRRIGNGERAGDRGDAAFGRGVAIATRDAHKSEVRTHVDHRAATALDKLGNPKAAAEKSAEEVELDRPPELLERSVDCGFVLSGLAAGIVVEHVEAAELIDRRTDRRLQTIRVDHVGDDRNGLIAGELRGFLARRAVNIGYRHPGAVTLCPT